MGKGFGKFKKLIKKGVPSSPKNGDKGKQQQQQEEEVHNTTPSSTPTLTPDELKPASVDVVTSSDAGPPSNAEVDNTPLLSGSHTDADDILDGILTDLNIKMGQLAVDAERTDTISEYSGGSAKSVESSSSDEDDETEEEETEDDETDDGGEGTRNKKHTIGDRVAAVVAAAEEIRKKKKRDSPNTVESNPSGRTTPVTEPGNTADNGGRETPVTESPESLAKSKELLVAEQAATVSKKKSAEGSRSSKNSKEESKGQSSKAQSKALSKASRQSIKSLRKSPITTFLPKLKNRTKTPEFSPEIQSNNNVQAADTDNIRSFDTKDDDAHTKDTQDISEGTFDENTMGDVNTLESNSVVSYDERGDNCTAISMSDSQSRNDGSTFDEASTEADRMKTKKTVMNKDIIIHQPGGPNSLVVRAMYYTPLPSSPEDIIIKVEASTVSFRDCLLRRGIGVDKIQFPFVPGCEVVGTISNIGKAARLEGYRVGDRIVGMTRSGGGNGYYAKLNTKNVSPVISSGVDAADAVCLVDVYMTAYQALRLGKKDGSPMTDANILITDGFSPVGQAAVQLAKLEGANVYVTTTETRQDEYMKTLGVKCLPLAPSKWLHKLKGKMDIVIDNTCFDSYDSSWKALNANGVLVCTGMTSIYSFQDHNAGGGCGCDAFGDMRDYQAKWAAIKAKYMMSQTRFHDLSESFQKDPKKYSQELKYLCFLVENGSLKPKIAERVSIEEVPDAQRYLETGKANGTIVCLP